MTRKHLKASIQQQLWGKNTEICLQSNRGCTHFEAQNNFSPQEKRHMVYLDLPAFMVYLDLPPFTTCYKTSLEGS